MGRGKHEEVRAPRTSKDKISKVKGRHRKMKITLVALGLILALIVGLIFFYVYGKLGKINRDHVDKKELSCVDVDGYVNILLLGVDARDMKDYKGCRTDCIIIASIKEDTGEVYLTSIYRDTFLKMGKKDQYDKITHAFAFGGAKLSVKSINQALDLNIDQYMVFNWKAVADSIDKLGGIDVNIEDYEIDELNSCTKETATVTGKKYRPVYNPGKHRLNGAMSVGYGRMRNGVGDDFKRTDRMRLVVKKMLSKMKKAKFSKINDLIDIVLPQIRTNMSNSDILALASRINKYKIVGSSGFPYKVSGAMINGMSCVIADDLENDVKKLHKKVFKRKDYIPTDRCRRICKQIEYQVGGNTTGEINVDKILENPAEHQQPIEETQGNTDWQTQTPPNTQQQGENPTQGNDPGGTPPGGGSGPGETTPGTGTNPPNQANP